MHYDVDSHATAYGIGLDFGFKRVHQALDSCQGIDVSITLLVQQLPMDRIFRMMRSEDNQQTSRVSRILALSG